MMMLFAFAIRLAIIKTTFTDNLSLIAFALNFRGREIFSPKSIFMKNNWL